MDIQGVFAVLFFFAFMYYAISKGMKVLRIGDYPIVSAVLGSIACLVLGAMATETQGYITAITIGAVVTVASNLILTFALSAPRGTQIEDKLKDINKEEK